MRTRRVCLFVAVAAAVLVATVSPAAEGNLPDGWRAIVHGAAVHGANGLYFDAHNRLLVASVFGREIAVVDPKSGELLDRIGPDRGVEGPDDLFIRDDGSIYQTSIFTGHVIRIFPDGSTRRQLVAPGVNPITMSDDGRLFVALDFLGDGLYELDPELVAPPRQIIAGNLGYLNGMDWGRDGRLYGPIIYAHKVVSIDVDSCNGSANPWVDCDIRIVADGFWAPAAVKFDSCGRLHVVDQDGSLYRVDTTTGSKTRIATLQEGLDNLAFDAKDRLFVSNADHGWVVEVLPGGTVRDLLRGGAIVPGGIAVVPSDGIDEAGAVDERIVVADVWSLRQYDGKTGRSLGYIIFPVGSGSPFTVAARGDQLVLSGWFDNGVRLYDLAARQVIWQDFFAVPLNAVPFGDDIAVSELLTGRVVRASDHSPLVSTPYVYVPAGLAARDGELWVVDWATGLLWKIAEAGTPLVPPRLVASGLSFPEGLAVDSDGSLLVVETGARRLSRVDPATGAVTVLIDDLELGLPAVPGTAPTAYFNGLAVGSEGAIYVTGDAGTQVYRYQPGSR